jgi:S-layer protein (TIGR01567 family)
MSYIKIAEVTLILLFSFSAILISGFAQNQNQDVAINNQAAGENLHQGDSGGSAGLIAPGRLIERSKSDQLSSSIAPTESENVVRPQNITESKQPFVQASAVEPASPKIEPATRTAIAQNPISEANAMIGGDNASQMERNRNYTQNVAATANKSNISAAVPAISENLTQTENTTIQIDEKEKELDETASRFLISETGGDRIWIQGKHPMEYRWTPQTFAGFFYDLKEGIGNETLDIFLGGSEEAPSRTISPGNLRYKTLAEDLDFKFDDWGRYQVIGFMANKYFAGYKGTQGVVDRDYNLINEGQLRKVLIDSDDERTISSGSVLPLEEGYELRIKEVDINGNKVYFALAKNGEEIDSKVISTENLQSSTYAYEVDIGGEDVPILFAHVASVFAGPESNLVTVNGLFQISDTFASVEPDDEYGKMKVNTVDDKGIEMENEESLSLKKGSTEEIFGNVGFQIADAELLRFAPVIMDRVGTYDVRGTLVSPQEREVFTWNPYNFEGFYYDIDGDIGTETLMTKITDSLKIQEGDLVYETSPQPVEFEFDNWGKYEVIGFLADKYFAGYNEDTIFTEEASSIDEGQLRKVLLDSDDERTISTGSVLPLEEGYELRIKQVDINGNKVYLALAKDGAEIDSKVVIPSASGESSSNYMYKVDISGKDVPIIATHLQSVFRGTETDLATIDGIFQVSDSPKSVEEGENYGKMKVESIGDTGIAMKNDDPITLSRDKTIELMENLRFEVADNSNRDFAPVAKKSAGGMPLNLNISEAVVNRTTTVLVRSDNRPVKDVQIFVGGNSIGKTDESGSAVFTPSKLGKFELLATKSGYVEAKTNIAVMSSLAEAMLAGNQTKSLLINAPNEVPKGDEFVISVTEFLNQTPVETAIVFFDSNGIGNTSFQGTLRYSSDAVGDHTIRAEKEGFKSGTRKIVITSQLMIQNLIVPAKAIKGKSVNVKANIQNAGKINDTKVIDLKVNGKVQESKEVSLDPGENRTVAFSFKPEEPGIYRISLDDKVSTVTVEESKTNYALIALLIILIALGAGFYLYETGRLEKFKKKPQGP